MQRVRSAESAALQKPQSSAAQTNAKKNRLGEQREDTTPDLEPDTFWAASRLILEQCFQILAPGAHAIWVVKGFVRDKAYVDFPDQWRRLCEAVGFETLHWHRAWLVEDHGEQGNMFGEPDSIRTENKSFFRRLAESKGSPPVDFEVILCMRKP